MKAAAADTSAIATLSTAQLEGGLTFIVRLYKGIELKFLDCTRDWVVVLFFA